MSATENDKLIFSPSGTSRWMACPASVQLSVGAESQDNVYTTEGTQAHHLLEICQRLDLQPSDMVGDLLGDSVEVQPFEVTEELAETVQTFMDYIAEFNPRTSKIEHFMQSKDMPGLQGTADYLNWVGDNLLIVADYKHGAGVKVSPEYNQQLMTYALLAMELYGWRDTAIIAIAQPRAMDVDGESEGVKVWTATREQLEAHKLNVQAAMKAARNGSPQLAAGDHCRWCPAKIRCPELHQLALREADKEFRLPSPVDLDAEQLAFWLKFKPILINWLDAISSHAKDQAENGVLIEGWKIVDAIANRSWSMSHPEVARSLIDAGFAEGDLFEAPKLKSPAQIEKITPTGMKKKDGKALVNSLTQRFTIGTKLVPTTDKRQPTLEGAVSSAQEDFGETTDGTT